MSCVLADGSTSGLDLERERPVRRLRDGQAVRRRDIAVRPAAARRRA